MSRGTTVLAKFTGHAGNFDEFVDNVLAKIAPGDQVKWLSGGEGEVINWRIYVLEEQLRDRRVHLPLHLVTRHHRDGRGGERLRP